MTDRAAGINGICLRGKAGWGENMAFLTAMSNAFGARWFDENWQPQFDQPEWKNTLDFYVKLMNDAGPQGASSNGFNENLALFQQGKCGMWIDATVAASFVSNPKESTVADKVGYALAPDTGLGKRGNWLWAWNARHPGRVAEDRSGREVHRLGNQQGLCSNSSPRRKAGPTCLRARASRSMKTPSTRRRLRSPR
jgi:sorbitol/mannitol transport system substrate-binding protein